MAGKIKCTYEDCFRHFDSVESMRKHKAKDPAHIDFYCKRCDEDCIDDTEYLIHQLSSPKHIACPLCGIEFKSEGGRERHVSIVHKAKQSMKCVGCSQLFDRAAGLMAHIENNKCKYITKTDFQTHQAEQQIERDAREEMQGGLYNPGSMVSGYSSLPSHGPNLLEDQRVSSDQGLDWASLVAEDTRRAEQGLPLGSIGIPGTITEGVSRAVIDDYPPLGAATSDSTGSISANLPLRRKVASYSTSENAQSENLLDIRDDANPWSKKPATTSQTSRGHLNELNANTPWNNLAIRTRPNDQKSSGVNQLDFNSTVNGTAFGTDTSIATRGTRLSQYNPSMMQNNPVPPAARPENQDPNAPYAQVQTQTRLRMPSQLELHTYWDPIQQCYICPGMKCSRRLRSVKEFHDHLLSAAHTGGSVQCPSCLKRFKTTTALVAHAESGSTKCDLRNSAEFDKVMRDITAGLIKVDGTWSDGSHKYSAVPVDQWSGIDP